SWVGRGSSTASLVRKNSRACVRSSRYDFTVCAEAFFSSARYRRKSDRASRMMCTRCSVSSSPPTEGEKGAKPLSKPRLRLGWARRGVGRRQALFLGLLRQPGGVEPVEAQLGVGRLRVERLHQRRPTRVIVDVNVALVALDQRQDVELSSHDRDPL